jgi:lipid A ethanolaminephosphotransferase
MFSHRGRKGFEARKQDDENLLDLLQRAGLAVLWIDNQAGCKGVCERIPQTMADNPPPADKRLCSDGECLDDVLLQGIDQRLAALPQARRDQGVVLVLHQMGSHGPAYYKRSPSTRKPFLPECTTNVLQQCERQALVNAYDNSIAYTDHVLAQAIAWLAQHADRYDTALLYVSDHGESLGENNLYLHGLPYALAPREQTHVPMLLWLAPGAARSLQPACLPAQRNAAWSHDNLFHSVLGLVGVTASEYQPALDVLAACRSH